MLQNFWLAGSSWDELWPEIVYSGTSLKRTSSKADTSLRWTENFVPVEFLRNPLKQNLSKADTLKRTLHKADTFFKSRMNIWTIIVLHKADT